MLGCFPQQVFHPFLRHILCIFKHAILPQGHSSVFFTMPLSLAAIMQTAVAAAALFMAIF
jgi:hypothetical protein